MLSYRKNRCNHRLLFGEIEHEVRRGWHRKLAIFMPEKVFGYERWEANAYGTKRWQIFVCRTAKSGAITKVPGIRPGAKLLLSVHGKTKAKRFLECLDRLKGWSIAPETVSDRQWMELSISLASGAKGDEACTIFEARSAC